jgi:hypothetical protein
MCHETGIFVEVGDARESTSTSLATVATRSRHDDPRHVALMMREELLSLEEGDIEGARSVLNALLMLVTS